MSILLASAVILVQIATGALLLLLVPQINIRSKYAITGLGLALGTLLSMLSSVILNPTILGSIAWLIPTILVGLVCTLRITALREKSRELEAQRSESIGVVVGLAAGLILLAVNWIRVPLSSIRAGSSVDMYFLEALSRGISQFGPEHSILMSGGALRYHWFTYGWAGELTQVAGLDSFVALTRFLPLVALLGMILIAASWAASIRVNGKASPWWVPSLAVLLIVVGGYTGALYGVILNFDSPSQSLTTVWLLGLVFLFLHGLRTESRPALIFIWFAIGLLALGTTGGKASHAVVGLGGIGLVVITSLLFRKSDWKRAISLGLAAILGVGIAYFWVLFGVGVQENLSEVIAVRASTWQGLDPVSGRWGPLLGTIAMLLAIFARLAGTTWLFTSASGRRLPELIFSLGAFLTGALALLFLREGINELWFLLAASAPIAVISAYGVGQAQISLIGRIGMRKAVPITLLIAGIASLGSLILSRNWVFESIPSPFFQWPGVLFWLAIVSVWVVIPALAFLFLRKLTKSGKQSLHSIALPIFAVSVSALVLTSILTRPSVLWTESRPLTTGFGTVKPSEPSRAGENKTSERTVDSLGLEPRINAADWLKENSQVENVVVTNRPDISFIPAFTGNQMYLAGEPYQYGLGAADQRAEIERRSLLSRSLTAGLTPVLLNTLCQEGIDFAWIESPDESFPPNDVVASETFGNISIYDLRQNCMINY
ncbi:hypothetical protein [Arsukibacterium sp.]|uniref:hypothetical protein n=1 Tax=Arsukibacterium sp. TaxID=1977258 RepID=UPI001BD4FE52|nr:hypothetical protein [Arsukibacterium sp.]